MLRFDQGVASHVGLVRSINQDAWLARPDHGVWVVADGMGGHARGEWASAEIVASIAGQVRATDLDDACTDLIAAVGRANARLMEAGRDEAAIGSTVAALIIKGGLGAILWAGDSRVYRCRGGLLQQLTRDHSQVEQLVASGLITRDEAAMHPMGHVLTRAVGVRSELSLDRVHTDVLADDMFLLCSDGLTRPVSEEEIAAWLRRETPRRAASGLLQLALDRGAPDNVTLVVVGCDATTLLEV